MFMMDKSQSTLEAAAPGNKAMTIPCSPHKPSQEETHPQSCPSQDPVVRKKNRSVSFSTIRPWHRDFPELYNSQSHEASFPDTLKDSQSGTESVRPSAESRSLRVSFKASLEVACMEPWELALIFIKLEVCEEAPARKINCRKERQQKMKGIFMPVTFKN
ncbi:Surfeit locus protein 6 [Sciurus carolinensis]|uniref:Surfeit locus protein 6 n=1 Tax=Sciurus carolinensis TaxID=30640 RepID=A0AA41TAL1_SCICA|nr:Surfeit locus protein 6 [Sciurus carolinensis]